MGLKTPSSLLGKKVLAYSSDEVDIYIEPLEAFGLRIPLVHYTFKDPDNFNIGTAKRALQGLSQIRFAALKHGCIALYGLVDERDERLRRVAEIADFSRTQLLIEDLDENKNLRVRRLYQWVLK